MILISSTLSNYTDFLIDWKLLGYYIQNMGMIKSHIRNQYDYTHKS
jgi:hypothetical protein